MRRIKHVAWSLAHFSHFSKWFPFPLLCFQASQGRSWENPFPLVNRHLLTPVLESWVGGLLAAPQGTAPNPEDLVRCPPHWVQVPSFPPSPPETVSRCAQRSSTWMTPVAPKRDSSPAEWPGAKYTHYTLPLRTLLFHCQAHDLSGIWKFTTLWGERDKEIQAEALYQVKGFYYKSVELGWDFAHPSNFLGCGWGHPRRFN